MDWLAANDPSKVDPVIEIAITPNRPDALGVRGIALDLAARGLGTMKPAKTAHVEGQFASPIAITIDEDTRTDGCEVIWRAPDPGRHQWPKPRMAAETAARHRVAADFGAGRYHQFLHL